MSDGSSHRWMYVYGAIAAAVIVLVAVCMLTVGQAKVEGDTPKERIASISELAQKQPRGAGRAIADRAANDPDESVRQVAMGALSKFIDPEFRPVLEAGTRDKSAGIRAAAAATLALYADQPAIDRLGALLTGDPAETVRREAADALAQCPAGGAMIPLVETMDACDNQDTRLLAARALATKFNMRHRHLSPAGNNADWLDFVERIKGAPDVQEAFRSAGRTLRRNPAHLRPTPSKH